MHSHLKKNPESTTSQRSGKPNIPKQSTKTDSETKEMLERLFCLGGLTKSEMCRMLELKRISVGVNADEVERLMVQHFKSRGESSLVLKKEFTKYMRELGVKNNTIIDKAFAAFDSNPSKGVPYHDVVDGICIFMRFPFERVLSFYFGSMDNKKMTRSEFREVLSKYAPALFAKKVNTRAIDELVYDLDTCSLGVYPPRFLQQVKTEPTLNGILCNDPVFFKPNL